MSLDWTRLTTAEGDASAVPELLEGLCAPDRETAWRSYRILSDLICPEGELFSAASGVAEEIVGLLSRGRLPHVTASILLLAEMEASTWSGMDLVLESDVRRTIERGTDLYMELRSHPSEEVRRATGLLLSCYQSTGHAPAPKWQLDPKDPYVAKVMERRERLERSRGSAPIRLRRPVIRSWVITQLMRWMGPSKRS